MTKSVTARDALVLQPFGSPDQPRDLSRLMSDFVRMAQAFASGTVWRAKGALNLIAASPNSYRFKATPILRDGFIGDLGCPAWERRITSATVREFVTAPIIEVARPADSWGARGVIQRVTDSGYAAVYRPAIPLIDPILDLAAADEPGVVATEPMFTVPCAEFYTGWERVDAMLSTGRGELWFDARKRSVRFPTGRVWLELEGIRDRDDPKGFEGMWAEPRTADVYLGWHTYFYDAGRASERKCTNCGAVIIGRRSAAYCGEAECQRERAAKRQSEYRRRRT